LGVKLTEGITVRFIAKASWQNFLFKYDVEVEAEKVIKMSDEEYKKAYAATV